MTSAPSAAVEHGDVLDEADPHAGDDAVWTGYDLGAVPPTAAEPAPLLFWKGLVLGLFLSATAWCLLLAVAVALYSAFAP